MLMFFAILIGFALVAIIHSITYGALETVKTKAARYFSGHLSITGYTGGIQNISDSDSLVTLLENSDLPVSTVSPRTVYYRSDASLFFNGESIRQRRLIGIEFNDEYDELSQLDFLEGSIDELLANDDSKGILISEVAARILGARIGDDITLYMTTDTGQYNSATLLVRGIFRETSLFGYVAYMNRYDLNSLILRDRDYATDIAVYTDRGSEIDSLEEEIRTVLADQYLLLPPLDNKADLSLKLFNLEDKSSQYLVPLTLDIHLDKITTIMDAVKIVTWFIEVLFMLIIMVGILNTYRVLVYERTKEIGTLRAIGMTQLEIRIMFLSEAFFLDFGATIAGFILFRVILVALGKMDISSIPGSGLFSEKGFLVPYADFTALMITALLMLAAVLIAAWSPAENASRLSPVDAMRQEN